MSKAGVERPLLEARGISKSFPGVRALNRVTLEVLAGEVHALLGENGAGKSTLMHILAGVFPPDEGSLHVDGEPVSFPNPRTAQTAGVAMVFQERSLAGPLSVAENVFFARQPVDRWGVIDRKQMERATRNILAELDIQLNPDTPVEELSLAEQQMVEIAKALSLNARLLVLDEPTSTLTESETSTLFRVIEHLRNRGAAVIYISHRMSEIFRICDRITVLRDGENQGTFNCSEVSEEQLISRMVGREFRHAPICESSSRNRGLPALEVFELSDEPLLRRVNLRAYSGEITGIAGLAGSGRTELALAIFGARPITHGRIHLCGNPVVIRSPRAAIRAGIGYLPEDRKEAGLFLEMGLPANYASAGLERFGSWWLSDGVIQEQAQAAAARLRLSNSGATSVQELSGGSQQKVMLARWLLVSPPVFIVDEPTRGIDIGAKLEVHQLLRELAKAGAAIIFISSELPEILSLADRILVMREGQMVGEIPRTEATEETVLRLAALPHSSYAHANT